MTSSPFSTITVQFCKNCQNHGLSTRHDESKYKKMFEQLQNILGKLQYNVIQTNDYRIGAFQVCIGNYVVFSKLKTGYFPNLIKLSRDIVEIAHIMKTTAVTSSEANVSLDNPESRQQTAQKQQRLNNLLFTNMPTYATQQKLKRVQSAKVRKTHSPLPSRQLFLQSVTSSKIFSGRSLKIKQYKLRHHPETILYGKRTIQTVRDIPISIQPAKPVKNLKKMKTQPAQKEFSYSYARLFNNKGQMSKEEITSKLHKLIAKQEELRQSKKLS